LNDIIKNLPEDIIHDAIRAQYANCEVTRHCVLKMTWEIKRLERWKSFHARSLEFFQEQNMTSQGKLEFWRSWCATQGIEVRSQDEEATWNLLEDESSALEHLQRHFRHSEDTAVSLGAITVDRAITNERESDTGGQMIAISKSPAPADCEDPILVTWRNPALVTHRGIPFEARVRTLARVVRLLCHEACIMY